MNIMKNLRAYEKPSISSIVIQSNKSVADVCWGEGSSGASPMHYYDTEGHGFVKFTVNTPDCKAWDGKLNYSEYTCLYRENGTYSSNPECPHWTQELENAAMREFQEAFDAYYATVSNHGSSAKGFSNTFPEDPHGMS